MYGCAVVRQIVVTLILGYKKKHYVNVSLFWNEIYERVHAKSLVFKFDGYILKDKLIEDLTMEPLDNDSL